jgi:hypothetical protein
MSTASSTINRRLQRSRRTPASPSTALAPGLPIGFIVPPQRLRESVMASVRSGGWTASGFAFAAVQRMSGLSTLADAEH